MRVKPGQEYEDAAGSVYTIITVDRADAFLYHKANSNIRVQVACSSGPNKGKNRFVGYDTILEMMVNGNLKRIQDDD